MWNNYGLIPSSSEGLELRIVPPSELEKVTDSVEDLRDILFDKNNPLTSTTGKKIGELAGDYEKSISEAIVAIPYIQAPGKLKKKIQDYLVNIPTNNTSMDFFKIFPHQVNSESVLNLNNKLQKYVFPPGFDFHHMPGIDRFVMFVFEFEQKLKRSDLQDIWQGVMPECARQITEQESSLAFSTESNEMLGSFLKDCTSNILDDKVITTTFNNLKWLVFKVKQRAKNNYSGVTPDTSDDLRIQNTQGKGRLAPGQDLPYSYNWPYDYCSLVELASMTSELTLGRNNDKIDKGTKPGQRPEIKEEEVKSNNSAAEKPCECNVVPCCCPQNGPHAGGLHSPSPPANSSQSGGPPPSSGPFIATLSGKASQPDNEGY